MEPTGVVDPSYRQQPSKGRGIGESWIETLRRSTPPTWSRPGGRWFAPPSSWAPLPHEAEDLAQTTLVRCYTGWDKVSSADNRDAYVYRMLLNCLRDVAAHPVVEGPRGDGRAGGRRPGRYRPRSATAPTPSRWPTPCTGRSGCLTKPNRDVVVLRYFVQLTERQTADVLGVPAGTVKSRLSRSLALLAANDHILDLSGGASR